MDMATLRTGVVTPKPLVATAMLSLRTLMENNPIAFFEVASLARDPSHQLFGDAEAALRKTGLLDDNGALHQTTREVILAAVEGDDLDMRLVSPIAPTQAKGRPDLGEVDR